MKMKLQIRKDDGVLCAVVHEVTDADSFGKACKDLWIKLRERSMENRTSIGDLIDSLDQWLLDRLNGAQVHITRID